MPDPHRLSRFIEAQDRDFATALAELRAGRKRSHWMWYVFPQLEGLGRSATACLYALSGLAEARAYLEHPLLGPRLVHCCETLLALEGRTAHAIFGAPDDLKLRSCATLFSLVAPAGSVFERLLEQFFQGERDGRTLSLLGLSQGGDPPLT